MKTLSFELRTEEAIVLTPGASRGEQGSLSFIPGSVILGLTAGEGRYARAETAGHSWAIFHRAKVRFGDARLIDETEAPALATPLCFF